MSHIPVGTKLSITDYIPLPVPRPSIPVDADHTGALIRKEITDLPDIYSWKEKVGLELMKEEFNNYILEPIAQFYGYLEPKLRYVDFIDINPIVILGLELIGILGLGIIILKAMKK